MYFGPFVLPATAGVKLWHSLLFFLLFFMAMRQFNSPREKKCWNRSNDARKNPLDKSSAPHFVGTFVTSCPGAVVVGWVKKWGAMTLYVCSSGGFLSLTGHNKSGVLSLVSLSKQSLKILFAGWIKMSLVADHLLAEQKKNPAPFFNTVWSAKLASLDLCRGVPGRAEIKRVNTVPASLL